MSKEQFFFTSESVTEGHPDKVADQISDSILDAIMAEDKKCRVACETLVTTGLAFIAGEITTDCYVEMPQIVRDTIKDIGYNSSEMGFDWQSCAILTSIDKQSADIAQGVDEGSGIDLDQGAGDHLQITPAFIIRDEQIVWAVDTIQASIEAALKSLS